jgi:hypothetical protein
MALTTISDVKATAKRRYLNFDYTTRWTDTIIGEIITEAQKDIEEYTGRIFDEQTITDTYSGYEQGGGYKLQLNQYPITDITSVTINGTEQTENTDYYILNSESGLLGFETELPSSSYNNIVIEYKAGYTTTDKRAKRLCEDIVILSMWMERETPPNLQTIIQDPKGEVYNRIDKSDRMRDVVYDIQSRVEKLPRKTFYGGIGG